MNPNKLDRSTIDYVAGLITMISGSIIFVVVIWLLINKIF